MTRIQIDDKLEREISEIMNTLNSQGYKVNRPDVIRMLIQKHKSTINVRRKTKSREWEII